MTEKDLRKTCRYLVGAARRVWRWNTDRKVVNETAEKLAGKAGFRVCAKCHKASKRTTVHVDHIIPVGHAPTSFSGWDDYYTKLFCEKENLQCLCTKCHKAKTSREAKLRRKVE